MSVRMSKPWLALDAAAVAKLGGHMGVFQIADLQNVILYIGCADARSRLGLRGELTEWMRRAQDNKNISLFRVEVTTAYMTRWRELLMAHQHDFGELPLLNDANDARWLGRLAPA